MERCAWAGDDPLYMRYHDEDWGVPVHEDRTHFEFLVLESAQAGLSWITVLRRRENYRRLYDQFDPRIVAEYGEEKIEALLGDAGIIRNRMKVESSVNNARRFLEVQEEFGSFNRYLWNFVGGKPLVNRWSEMSQIPASTELSDRVSKDLKKRGFRFIGTTIIYAHLQAVGLVNDHLVGCFRYKEIVDGYPPGSGEKGG
ncbi:MAG: DNA-3-methyladenine glycosylase I [Gemmatimonadetes bacterium]|jgi:DNA-3-methyladenine glycosylase I|nr:DNA-3-methyladenine glycosylase I [Gemmatimonadota bacterium]